jgi:hypothetical protein
VSVQQRGRVWILVLLFFVLVTEPMITWGVGLDDGRGSALVASGQRGARLGKGCVLLYAWLVVRGFPRWRSARVWFYLTPVVVAVAVLAAAASRTAPQFMG